MCPEHSRGECQFSHDETKAAAIRSDAAERARIKARLERREQVRRERQAKAAGTGVASNQRTQGSRGSTGSGRGGSGGSGRGRGGQGGGDKQRSDKKTGSANAAAAEPGDGRGSSSSVSLDSSQYGSARVMRLGNGGSNGSGNCAQRSSHAESDEASETIDSGNVDGTAGAVIYGGAPYLQLGGTYASANAVCSIMCCVMGTHGRTATPTPRRPRWQWTRAQERHRHARAARCGSAGANLSTLASREP